MTSHSTLDGPRRGAQLSLQAERVLWLFAGLALVVGLWARFKGLGAWPFEADEYYIARSVENVLNSGLPAYPCGGYYDRGITQQYLSALLQLAGLTPALSIRVIAALSSLIALPAVYLLGVRLQGRVVGLLAVSVMLLSTWEVDLARFGRMYTPFQAIFAWYLLAYLRYTVDRNSASARHMLILTVAGILTWEGGAFLALANCLAPYIRKPTGDLDRDDFKVLAWNLPLFLFAYWTTQTDFRTLGHPVLPPELEVLPRPGKTPLVDTSLLKGFLSDPAWAVSGVLLLAMATLGIRWAWNLGRGWPAAVALSLTLLAAATHQFSAVVFLIILCLLMRMVFWRDLLGRSAWPLLMALGVSLALWVVFAAMHPALLAAQKIPWGVSSQQLSFLYEFLSFPNFPARVALPWAWTAPLLGALLFTVIVVSSFRVIGTSRPGAEPSTEQVTVLLIVFFLALVALTKAPRFETRYAFFLYPAVVAIAVTVVYRTANFLGGTGVAGTLVASVAVLGAFAFAGDIQPRRLLAIDTADAFYGLGRFHSAKSNVLGRSDPQGAADWLRANADRSTTLLINAYPTVDFYFRHFDYSYIDRSNQRLRAYSCRLGTVDRWSNLPLLWNLEQLEQQIARRGRALIVIDFTEDPAVAAQLMRWHSRIVWTSIDGHIQIVEVESHPT